MSLLQVLLIHDPEKHHDPRGAVELETILRSASFQVTSTDDVSAVERLSGGKFDCIMIYTQGDTFSPAQVGTLVNFVRSGGGLVGVHSATATNKTDDAYARLLGSRFIGHGPVFDFEVSVSD